MGRQAGNVNFHEEEQLRKLFIGGLNYRTTNDSLKSFYEQWGEIVDVVVMKHPQTQKSRGFGFVTYASSSMVDEAMKNRPHKIDGREVDSKRAVPRDENGAATGANINIKKLFVGGLKEQTEDDLREYFDEFGTIIKINFIIDKQTGNRKGYAFIEFDDYDPVDKALLKRDHAICGKSVTVNKAIVKDSGMKGRTGRGSIRGSKGVGPWAGSQGGWGYPVNGYGSGGPWGSGWDGQYSSAWNSGGYQQSYSGGPIKSNYSGGGGRSGPYGGSGGGGSYGSGGYWENERY